MARAKYQVLVIPYYAEEKCVKYCIFRRRDMEVWQFIAGGGESEDGSVLDSAKREAYEEANIAMNEKFVQLDTLSSIPSNCFRNAAKLWGEACLVIPEYTFAVRLNSTELKISHEHTEYEWVTYETAGKRLQYDSNKTALWELDNRIRLGLVER